MTLHDAKNKAELVLENGQDVPGCLFQNYPNTITQLSELAEKLLHTFKGVSGNLGATAMSLASNALDSQLKRGYYEITTYEHSISETSTCMQELSQLVNCFASNDLDSQLKQGYYEISTYEHWISKTSTCMQELSLLVNSFPPTQKSQDHYQLQQALDNLDILLQQNESIDEALLSQIESLLPMDKSEQFTTLLKLIYATNYHAARVILKILKDY